MRKTELLIQLILIAITLTLPSIVPASAHNDVTSNDTSGVEKLVVVVNGDGTVTAKFCAGAQKVVFHYGTWIIKQSDNIGFWGKAGHPFSLAPNKCHTWNVPQDFPDLELTSGEYRAIVDTTKELMAIEWDEHFTIP